MVAHLIPLSWLWKGNADGYTDSQGCRKPGWKKSGTLSHPLLGAPGERSWGQAKLSWAGLTELPSPADVPVPYSCPRSVLLQGWQPTTAAQNWNGGPDRGTTIELSLRQGPSQGWASISTLSLPLPLPSVPQCKPLPAGLFLPLLLGYSQSNQWKFDWQIDSRNLWMAGQNQNFELSQESNW